MPRVVLQLLAGEYAICRLAPDEPVPAWAGSVVFSGVIRVAGELSVVCPSAQVPAGIRQESGWRLFKFQGPFQFSETGILSAVLAPLATAGVSILAQSTFDTDYLFVKATQLEAAVQALAAAGHTVQR
jgi:hypothetical protein